MAIMSLLIQFIYFTKKIIKLNDRFIIDLTIMLFNSFVNYFADSIIIRFFFIIILADGSIIVFYMFIFLLIIIFTINYRIILLHFEHNIIEKYNHTLFYNSILFFEK
jgi:hypothetical protein